MNERSKWNRWLGCAVLMVGCGQKAPGSEDPMSAGGGPNLMPAPGGGGGGAEPPAVDYLPLLDGSSFTYSHSTGWAETITVSATTYEGQAAFLLTDTPNPNGERTESVFLRAGQKVLRVYKEAFDTQAGDALTSSVEYRPGFLRADNAWANASVEVEMNEAYQRTETPAGQTPGPTEDRSHAFVLEGVEDVVTAAGRFNGCLRVRRQRTWQEDVATDEGQEKRFWFAPGVGKVREETLDNGNTEELVAYAPP